MDRRTTPFSGRKALETLRGQVEAEFTTGTPAAIIKGVVDLLKAPNGPRDRQLLWGDRVLVIDRDQGHAFVQAAKDGYCGWIAEDSLGPDRTPTHWVSVRASHLYSGPKVQSPELCALPFGAKLAVIGVEGKFAMLTEGYVPLTHLRALDDLPEDPVGMAEILLGSPYLWGGNSAAGIDCSGLVQGALLACGRPCPGDSDQQQTVGSALAEDAPLQRGDLLFWKGHVAMVSGPDQMIHANGHSMDVRHEGITEAIARILAQEGGPLTARRRP